MPALFVGDWIAWQLAYPDLTFDAAWSSFGRLRPVHTSGVIFGFGGNALIATSFYVLQRTSRARLPDQLSPWFVLLGYNLFCVIAATGYLMGVTQSKEYAEPEWYADIWLVIVWVDLFHHLPAHAGSPQGAAYLRVELVLHGLHSGRGDPPHRQQSGDPGVARPGQELLGILRRAGCDDAVVVRAQRRRVLPDRRLPRHDVLLSARSRRPPDLFLSAVDHQLLGHHLHVHVGGLASSALHGAAAMGADARHDVLGDAAGAVMGVGRQRAADAERRLAQGSRRRDPALHDGRGGVLRPGDVRRLVHGHPLREFAVALYRLDRRSRACRRARLGRDDYVRRNLRIGAVALEARADVFRQAGGSALLARARRNGHLRFCDVEFRHHPGADVADLQ